MLAPTSVRCARGRLSLTRTGDGETAGRMRPRLTEAFYVIERQQRQQAAAAAKAQPAPADGWSVDMCGA